MCGRFALYTPPARMARYFDAALADDTEPGYTPSWNVAPTDQVLGVRDRPDPNGGEPTRTLMSFRWGLIPWWSKDAKSGSRQFNARSETVTTKAAFREAFRERRIIVPADGFYEWQHSGGNKQHSGGNKQHSGGNKQHSGGKKQPYFLTRADGEPMAFAGLAERWRDKSAPDAPLIRSCTIITAPGGADLEGIHDRMPVILDPATFDLWLDPANEDSEELRALLRPPPAGTMALRPVGPRVGNVANNDPTLIEAV